MVCLWDPLKYVCPDIQICMSYPVQMYQGQTLMVPQCLEEQLKKFLPLAVCYSLQLAFIPSLLSPLPHYWAGYLSAVNQLQWQPLPGVPVWALRALPWDGHPPCWWLQGLFPLASQEVTDHTLLPNRFIPLEQGPWPQCEQAAACLGWIFCWL